MSFQNAYGSGLYGGERSDGERRRRGKDQRRQKKGNFASASSYQSENAKYEVECTRIENMLKKYAVKIEKIKEISHQISDGSSIKRSELDGLHKTAQEANTMANNINKSLHSFSSLYRHGSLSNHEIEERGRKHQRLMRDSATLQQKFDSEIKRALRAEKELSMMQRKQSEEGDLLDLEDGEGGEQQKLLQYVDQEELDNEISFCEALLEERSRGIEDLQKEMVEVGQMFQDLHAIIVNSRTDVETIEGHMSSTLQQANKGLQHIRKGDEYQSSTRRTLLCTTLCLAICLGTLLLYFAVVDGGGAS